MLPNRPNLSSWVDQHIEMNRGHPLFRLSRFGEKTLEATGMDPDRSSALIANAFWQSFVRTPTLARTVFRALGVANGFGEMLVVPHGSDCYTLLVESHSINAPRAVNVRDFVGVNTYRSELMVGYERSALDHREWALTDARWVERSRATPRIEDFVPPRLVQEVAMEQPFCLIAVPPLSQQLTSIPLPSVRVSCGASLSTAGACVRDNKGREGVTAPAHAVPDGASVTVGGVVGQVVCRDDSPITDSCFIALEDGKMPNSCKTSGPLMLAPPRQHEDVTFEGSSSGKMFTRRVAWNYELPAIDPNLQ